MVTADDKVYKHYFNNLIILLLFYVHVKLKQHVVDKVIN